MKDNYTGLEIAIIGMAGRFPGADNINEYWKNLAQGIETISFLSKDEIDKSKDKDLLNHPKYVNCLGGKIQNKFDFDPEFFGYSHREAELMNPQIRFLHECCWETLEDAGYCNSLSKDSIGLFAGCVSSSYWEVMISLKGNLNDTERFATWPLRDVNFATTLVSYGLNLTGPSVFIQTACSTSLTAIHMASRSLLLGECKMALAGGVSLNLQKKGGYVHQEGMIFSSDGHCKAFSEDSDGTIGGEGVGMVLLKPLKAAIRDNDNIYAIVKGSAINNDGNRKVGYTAPSIKGQVEVIRKALHTAKVNPESIGYVETHGTGTKLGDSTEIEALKQAFQSNKRHFCGIGSVKTNLGHLDTAAGVAGLIKTVLALKNRQVPPSLNFKAPNPNIDFENSPFYVNTELKKWENNGQPRRAGISSFGIGGTNSHLILEEAPKRNEISKNNSQHLILLSAKSEYSLEGNTENLRKHLKDNQNINFEDMAFTLQVGRKPLDYRRCFVASNNDDAIRILSDTSERKLMTCYPDKKRKVVFMFSGLGTQYSNMGLDLYNENIFFRERVDSCCVIANKYLTYDIKKILYNDNNCNEDSLSVIEKNVNDPVNSQLLTFIIEYALAKLLLHLGVKPYAMIGYSFGEYVAACISGVFTLEDALKLIIYRGQLFNKIPQGAMVSVPLTCKQVESLLNDKLSIAIDNGKSCIVAGENSEIDDFVLSLKGKKIICFPLPSNFPLHSHLVDNIIEEYIGKLHEINFSIPSIPYISNVTGTWIAEEAVLTPEYWGQHLRNRVLFAKGIKELTDNEDVIFVEIGPDRNISNLVKQLTDNKFQSFNFFRNKEERVSDYFMFLNRLGQLWLRGIDIDWDNFYLKQKRNRLSLPKYSFDKENFSSMDDEGSVTNLLKIEKSISETNDLSQWFYAPMWQQSLHAISKEKVLLNSVIYFISEHEVNKKILSKLRNEFERVIVVQAGEEFKQIDNDTFLINMLLDNDYIKLIDVLKNENVIIRKIIHSLTLNDKPFDDKPINNTRQAIDFGFYSIKHCLKALKTKKNIDVILLTNGIFNVIGSEELFPEKSVALGLLNVIPQEYPGIKCYSIDLNLKENLADELINNITEQLKFGFKDKYIAYRNGSKYTIKYQPIELEESSSHAFRENGVYVIIGGLGNIGLNIAKLLNEEYRAKLILTSRSDFPERDNWNDWLATHEKDDAISVKIRTLLELIQKGSEILVSSCEISDQSSLKFVFDSAEKKFGKINGVVHSAGKVTKKSIEELDNSEIEMQFKSKIYGMLALKEVVSNRELDFVVLVSSLSSVLGGIGFGAYSSANNYMNSICYDLNRSQNKKIWKSVSWQAMNDKQTIEGMKRSFLVKNIEELVVVKGGDLETKLQQWIINIKDVAKREKKIGKVKKRETATNLLSEYKPPENNTEKELTTIWQDYLGLDKVGVDDNFFDLGATSLKIIEVHSKITEVLEIDISVVQLFKYPSIRMLADSMNENNKEIQDLSAKKNEKNSALLASTTNLYQNLKK